MSRAPDVVVPFSWVCLLREAEYRVLLHTSATPFEFCKSLAYLILMEGRKGVWWLERV